MHQSNIGVWSTKCNRITLAHLWINQRFFRQDKTGLGKGRGMTSGNMSDLWRSRRMTMKKRALLVGCNYPDFSADKYNLDGCWNDVDRMREKLISRFGFERDCICELVDRPGTDPKFVATGANIREMLHHSLRDLESGDAVVFHFSGHGVRVKYRIRVPSLSPLLEKKLLSQEIFSLRLWCDLTDYRWTSAIIFLWWRQTLCDVWHENVAMLFALRRKCVWEHNGWILFVEGLLYTGIKHSLT